MTIIISIIVAAVSIFLAILIKKEKLISDSELYMIALDKKSDITLFEKIRSYLSNSFYILGFIMIAFGIGNYLGYSNSMVIFIMALITWFVVVLVGAQLIVGKK